MGVSVGSPYECEGNRIAECRAPAISHQHTLSQVWYEVWCIGMSIHLELRLASHGLRAMVWVPYIA